jgi:hypothetical protein
MRAPLLALPLLFFSPQSLASQPSPAEDLACSFAHPVREVSAIPREIENYVRHKSGWPPNLPLFAPRNGAFNAYDVFSGPFVPLRRFTRGGRWDRTWLLIYEGGGFSQFRELVVYDFGKRGNIRLLAHLTYDRENVCELADDIFDRKPPRGGRSTTNW